MAKDGGFVGIDVSKDHLDVHAVPSGESFRVDNTPEGVGELIVRLRRLEPSLVVLEASGKLETVCAASVDDAGFHIAVVNPRHVRDFARASGRLAKTDTLDAKVIAHFAQAMKPDVRPLRTEEDRQFGELLARRRQIVGMLTAEKNRLKITFTRKVRRRIRAHIRWLEQELGDADRGLAEAVQASPLWQASEAILRSVPGVGEVTSRTFPKRSTTTTSPSTSSSITQEFFLTPSRPSISPWRSTDSSSSGRSGTYRQVTARPTMTCSGWRFFQPPSKFSQYP